MIREKILKRLQQEAKASRLIPLSNRIGMSHASLWRIIKGKSSGSSSNWDKIFKYYGK